MTTTDYEHVRTLIRRLNRPTQARLAAEVVQAFAVEPTVRPTTVIDPRAALAEIRAHVASLGPISPTIGEQIDRDRQSGLTSLRFEVAPACAHISWLVRSSSHSASP